MFLSQEIQEKYEKSFSCSNPWNWCTQAEKEIYIGDSAATSHMTSDCACLYDLQKFLVQ